MGNNIKQVLIGKFSASKLINTKCVEKKNSFRGLNYMLGRSKNPEMCYLELMYEIIDMALDAAQLFEDWDRHIGNKKEEVLESDCLNLTKTIIK